MKDNNITVPFRTDGNAEIGMGHIMRCLALAQGMEKTGSRATFIVRDYDSRVIDIIRRYGYSIETIPVDSSWNEDLKLTLEYSDRCRSTLLITDLGNAVNMAKPDGYRQYLRGLRDSGKYLVALDDLGKVSLPADIVINPHCGVKEADYNNRNDTRFLLGSDYFIFRPEFIAAARVKREIKSGARNVLVAVGGSDPRDITGRVVVSLVKSNKTHGLNLRIVIGMDGTESKRKKLEAILKNYPGRYELIQGSDDMARLMLWSDLTVTGGGLTKYEVAATGTPCIIIPQYDYLLGPAEEFEKTGAALNLGSVDIITDETIAGMVASLLSDVSRRTGMSRRGRELVDGRGIERILAEIPDEVRS